MREFRRATKVGRVEGRTLPSPKTKPNTPKPTAWGCFTSREVPVSNEKRRAKAQLDRAIQSYCDALHAEAKTAPAPLAAWALVCADYSDSSAAFTAHPEGQASCTTTGLFQVGLAIASAGWGQAID